MAGGSLLDRLTTEYRTELSRLGSSKSLYAATGGDLDTDTVLDVLAAKAAASNGAVAEWDADDPDTAAMFADAAATFAEQRGRIVEAGGNPDAADPGPVYERLDGVSDPAARLGALLGHAVVSVRTLDQAVGFFVGNADPGTADVFRGMRDDAEARRDRVADALGCRSEAERDRGYEAAGAVIEAAYDGYVDRLESMGVNPKPVC
jgi:hypothetical protein